MRTALRRRYVWVLLLLAAIAVGWVTYRVIHPPWADSEAWRKYEQIRVGMSQRDAAEVIGRQHPSRVVDHYRCDTWVLELGWRIGDDDIQVEFEDFTDQARQKRAIIRGYEFCDPPRRPVRLSGRWWDRLLDRLGW